MNELRTHLQDFRRRFEPRLVAALDRRAHRYTPSLHEALRYTPMAGGKRLRPVVLELFAALGKQRPENEVLDAGVAIELIHACSLVLDDLPSMDDASLRRGMPTCHVAFGLDTAILAANAQLMLAFELLGELDAWSPRLEATALVARAVGLGGMIGGQHVDLHLDDAARDLEALEYIHRHKTGVLFEAAAKIGVRIGQGDDATEECAAVYARNLGLAFQIKDDLLDVTGTAETTGKDVGQDAGHATFVERLGAAESTEIMHRLLDTARASVQGLSRRNPTTVATLERVCDYVGRRDH